MKKILVVDDELNAVMLFKKRLEPEGYQVLSASDGIEGLKKIREDKPDLILLDVMMPGLDGFSVVREIRADEALKAIPVVIVTARGELGDLFRVEGVSAVFEKPFKGDEVLSKIRQLIG